MVYLSDESGCEELVDLFPDGPAFFLSKQHNHCFTGLDLGFTHRECSTTSLGVPLMSEGFHAKMSFSARRKSTSTLSYLLESLYPMHTICPSTCLGSKGSYFVSSVGLKVVFVLFTSGAYLSILQSISKSS